MASVVLNKTRTPENPRSLVGSREDRSRAGWQAVLKKTAKLSVYHVMGKWRRTMPSREMEENDAKQDCPIPKR